MTESDLKYWKATLNGVVPEYLVTPEVVALRDQQNKMLSLMAKKNADYGNAFNKGCDTMGEGYALCRIFDKANRFIKQAADKMTGNYNPNVNDESLYDTIQDLGNYCNMFAAWLEHCMDENNTSNIHSTGRKEETDECKMLSIKDVLRKGKCYIREEDSAIDVTEYIKQNYGFEYLSVDENNYVYNLNSDNSWVSVTSASGKLCLLYELKEK
uniref:Uncharacterized protein n=1 Tax=Geladintestivirus 3 TaxID=3233135 RepID=A0AAU8MJZ3_9CAUD